jgi:hypothetical protein
MAAGLVHQLPAPAHEARRVGEAERARGVMRGELAERVAGGGAHVRREAVARDRPRGGAVREQRGLRVVRERQVVRGPLEAQRRERDAERRVDRLEGLARGGMRVGEVEAHSRLLRPLAGKEEYDVHDVRGAIRTARPSRPT